TNWKELTQHQGITEIDVEDYDGNIVPGFEVFDDQHPYGETLPQKLKHVQCFLYQCSEGNIPNMPLFKAVERLADEMKNVIIAYEPVWAIGTGETATVEQAGSMHHFIRSVLEERFGESTSEATSILYGGSVKPANAADLFAHADIDGGLVGGASLKADDFIRIIYAMGG
ncbi:MAG: triosephosphate isomerase, partial [Flavobacteriia bacterium]|nr:triosephosphate isomerase [Flavobacteriia bacterium]